MPLLAAATIVAKCNLALARVTAQSFRAEHPDIPFFVLVTDEIEGYFEPDQEAFELLSIDDLGKQALLSWCFRYDQLPLSYALTPGLLEYLLDRGFEQVLFIKQESLVLGRLSSVLDLLPQCSITLTPHLLKPLQGPGCERRELDILQAGTINGGLIGIRDTTTTRAALAWWRQRVEYNCLHDVAAGMHYEQRWLDLLPCFFADVRIIRDPGCNVGHWHLPERTVRIEGQQVHADDHPCSLFRFSGFEPTQPLQATRYFERLTTTEMGDAGQVFARYHRLLMEAGHSQCSHWPYTWAAFDNGIPVPAIARDLYRQLGPAVQAFGNPFASRERNSFFAWLTESVRKEAPGISRMWHALYLKRRDVMAAYPDPYGQDRLGLIGWINTTGWQEFAIDPRLCPRPAV
ncbi:MAG: hypothetical protein V4812_09930 [Pseudomonadota bacterium]